MKHKEFYDTLQRWKKQYGYDPLLGARAIRYNSYKRGSDYVYSIGIEYNIGGVILVVFSDVFFSISSFKIIVNQKIYSSWEDQELREKLILKQKHIAGNGMGGALYTTYFNKYKD